jgi:hypothetical protein
MVALLVGQIVEQTAKPYTWFPLVIVVWVALVGAGALWLAAARPDKFDLAGGVLAIGEVDEVAPISVVAG